MAHETNTPYPNTPPAEDPYYGLGLLPGARVSDIEPGQTGHLEVEVAPADSHKAERGLERLVAALLENSGDVTIDGSSDIRGSFTYERITTPGGTVGAVRHHVQGSGKIPKLTHITVSKK